MSESLRAQLFLNPVGPPGAAPVYRLIISEPSALYRYSTQRDKFLVAMFFSNWEGRVVSIVQQNNLAFSFRSTCLETRSTIGFGVGISKSPLVTDQLYVRNPISQASR
jgi:hypothetical protein